MRPALKVIVGLVAVAVAVLIAAISALYLNAAEPAHRVGFATAAVRDPQDTPLHVAIWYPTSSTPSRGLVGLAVQTVARNGAVLGGRLPLVIISHGSGGLYSSHFDTALALAAEGFVVAAVTHTGDNAQDDSYVGTPRWLVDRPRHIRVVLDYMVNDWSSHQQIDASRVGVFGFSAGGFTALVSIGGVPDLAQIATHCGAQPEFACTLWRQLPAASIPETEWIHDHRISAAVIIAPGYGFAFEPHGLSHVTAAVQLWNGMDDHNVPYQTNAAVVRRLLPTPPEYHAVPEAAHFSFLAPCPSWLFPMICKDAKGFDRDAFHRDFNRSVVAFYREHLAAR